MLQPWDLSWCGYFDMSAVIGIIRVSLLSLEDLLQKLLIHIVGNSLLVVGRRLQLLKIWISPQDWQKVLKTWQPDSEQVIHEEERKKLLCLLWPSLEVALSFPTTTYCLFRAALLCMGQDYREVSIGEGKDYGGCPWRWLPKQWSYFLSVPLEIKEFLVNVQQ